MQSPDQQFQRLLKELRPTLAEEEFRRKGQNFVIESPDCWGMINFQKSLYSAPGQKIHNQSGDCSEADPAISR